VKKLTDRLGAVRDTDVMIQGLQAYLQEVSGQEQAAGVHWLIAYNGFAISSCTQEDS
jgi:CHAD domain-containing protein